jgi:hypothetical protein
MTAQEKTKWATSRGIPRWMALALWDDVSQIVVMIEWQYRDATPAQRRDALRYELRRLRVEVWERRPCRTPKTPSSLRPSKLRAVTGYRSDPARHQTARNKVDAERRKQIAAMGAAARRNA